jgi:hypothetical protein
MQLSSKLEFSNGKLSKIGLDIPDEGEPLLTLSLKAPLAKASADLLGIAWVFATDTTANPYLKDAALINDIAFGDVRLDLENGAGVFRPKSVHGFRLHAAGGGGWGIGFKVELDSEVYEVLQFLQDNRTGFRIEISPLQQNLFAEEVAAEAKQEARETAKTVASIPEPVPEDRSHETRPRGGRRKRQEEEQMPFDVAEEVL